MPWPVREARANLLTGASIRGNTGRPNNAGQPSKRVHRADEPNSRRAMPSVPGRIPVATDPAIAWTGRWRHVELQPEPGAGQSGSRYTYANSHHYGGRGEQRAACQ